MSSTCKFNQQFRDASDDIVVLQSIVSLQDALQAQRQEDQRSLPAQLASTSPHTSHHIASHPTQPPYPHLQKLSNIRQDRSESDTYSMIENNRNHDILLKSISFIHIGIDTK